MKLPKVKPIPSLGTTAREVIAASFKLETPGMRVVYKDICGPEYELREEGNINRPYLETRWQGSIPLEGDRIGDAELERLVAAGHITITVQSPGRDPHYRKEYHRATGRRIPIGE